MEYGSQQQVVAEAESCDNNRNVAAQTLLDDFKKVKETAETQGARYVETRNSEEATVCASISLINKPLKVEPNEATTFKQEFDDEYIVSCLLMVFVAVSVPKLAKSESSQFKVQLDSHANNIG